MNSPVIHAGCRELARHRTHPAGLRSPDVRAGPAVDRARSMDVGETITTFTIAHSITLGLATPGFINVPSRRIAVLQNWCRNRAVDLRRRSIAACPDAAGIAY